MTTRARGERAVLHREEYLLGQGELAVGGGLLQLSSPERGRVVRTLERSLQVWQELDALQDDADMDQYGEDFTAAPAEVSGEAALAIANGGYDVLQLPIPPIVTEVGMTRCIAHVGRSSCRFKNTASMARISRSYYFYQTQSWTSMYTKIFLKMDC